MLPDRASLWVAGAAPSSQELKFWDSVYGFSMAPVRQALEAERLGHVAVAPVSGDDVITDSAQAQAFDLMRMSARDADFSAEFRLEAQCEVRTRNAGCRCSWLVPHSKGHYGWSEGHTPCKG